VTSFANRFDAHVAINAGYFGGGTSYSLVVDQGTRRASNISALVRDGVTYYPTRGAIGQFSEGSLDIAWIYELAGSQWAYPDPNPNVSGSPAPRPSETHPEGGSLWDVYNAVGGGPMLVMDGEIRLTWEEEVFFGGSGIDLTSRRARTVVGIDEYGELIILIWSESGSTGITLGEAAQVMLAAGAVQALNLDGGGSTNLTAAGTTLLETGRSVVSALLLAPAEDDASDDDAIIFDNGDECCYEEYGNWRASANSGYWADSPSRIVETGDGAARAVFRLHDIEAGTYEVSAWWVPSFNRATNTPYRLYSAGEESIVRVDQSVAATLNQWNDLGTFQLAAGDSIVVTNDAQVSTEPGFVNVDAVRLVRVQETSTAEIPQEQPMALSAYPNPASDRLAVEWGGSNDIARIRLVDVLGREVESIDVSGTTSIDVDVNRLAPGLYGLEAHGPRGVLRTMIVVR
jgi:hypothetical protein